MRLFLPAAFELHVMPVCVSLCLLLVMLSDASFTVRLCYLLIDVFFSIKWPGRLLNKAVSLSFMCLSAVIAHAGQVIQTSSPIDSQWDFGFYLLRSGDKSNSMFSIKYTLAFM